MLARSSSSLLEGASSSYILRRTFAANTQAAATAAATHSNKCPLTCCTSLNLRYVHQQQHPHRGSSNSSGSKHSSTSTSTSTSSSTKRPAADRAAKALHEAENAAKEASSMTKKLSMELMDSKSRSDLLERAAAAAEKAATAVHAAASDAAKKQVKSEIAAEVTEVSSELKDAAFIFETVMKRLEEKFGRHNLCFPKEIYWLIGAPGSGKGTMTKYIMGERGLTSDPLVVSQLLQGPEMQAMKDKGLLISDSEVIEQLFTKLLDREKYDNGVLVDGFPRTRVQAETIAMLYDRMHALRNEFQHTRYGDRFNRPKFRLCVLFVDEKTSIERQLMRGLQIQEMNRIVQQTGLGDMQEERETDMSIEAAQKRYKFFMDQVYDSITLLKQKFSYNFIDASGSIEQVAMNIVEEFKYQSSMELAKETFDSLSIIPPAEDLIKHARQLLVRRLDDYRMKNTELFNQVLDVIQKEFLHIMQRQALSGVAIIRSESEVFKTTPLALNMALDILTERGYQVILDYERKVVPRKVDPETHEILTREIKLYHFQIMFAAPKIRG